MNKYIPVIEMAKMLGISRIAIFKKIKNGNLKAEKFGRNYCIETNYAIQYANQYKKFKELSERKKQDIEKFTKRVFDEYGEALKMLSKF